MSRTLLCLLIGVGREPWVEVFFNEEVVYGQLTFGFVGLVWFDW